MNTRTIRTYDFGQEVEEKVGDTTVLHRSIIVTSRDPGAESEVQRNNSSQ